jgi:two-component system sensor histidine kinase/response regulator
MENGLSKIRGQAGQNKARVLIIDDDAVFSELARIHLSLAGFAPEMATDGVEGGKALLASPPDLVLCDLKMPFMSGLDLLSLMRTDQGMASIPVILVSGHSDEDTIAKAMQLGAADFLIKPVMVEDLLNSIHTCLARRGRKVAGELQSA